MVGIKYKDLDDLNAKARAWCEKVNLKIHSTTNEIPKVRLLEENLSKITRRYFIDVNHVRKVEKDCLFSYKGNKYSVPPKYIYRYVSVFLQWSALLESKQKWDSGRLPVCGQYSRNSLISSLLWLHYVSFRDIKTTHSTCTVFGNISTHFIFSIL